MTNYVPNTWATGNVVTKTKMDRLEAGAAAALPSADAPALILATVATVTALADAATIATNAALGKHFRVTLAGNRTLGNPTNGQVVTWEILQDATGSRTLTLGSAFALGTTISSTTLTTTAAKRDFLTAVYNSTTSKWYVINFVKGY